jgi:hypothetical protein
MPEILRGRSPLEDFPQHVHALGMAVVELAALEITCVHLLAALLQTTEAVADAILMSSTSTRARIDIIKSVVLAKLSEASSKPIVDLMNRCEKILNKRNTYVHGIWGVEHGKVKLVPIPKGEVREITINELADFVTKIRITADDVQNLTVSIFEAPR